ncbi:T-cell surface glycoprotein CD1c3 isoform X2 [Erinaceus europaeus]|uniref:T-cell surface glycoprotein CD1c3 isoform X2 n=1 Tax=Erinaceus europaeus TaxID=9365 RepID=A0ABM3XY16_ERIEU|nr:T-cell surface glycoprotein CD1c3 isoform X2 [Erinaceus europaeus]
MLLLPLAFLSALRGGDSVEVQEHVLFHVIQISSFANRSWVQNLGSGWLGELQTHGWDSAQGTIIFLHSWSRGNFSNQQLTNLELLFRFYFSGITQEIQEYSSQLQFEYPFILQADVGCELYSGATLKSFFQVAYQGSDFLSLQNMSWVPAPEGENKARRICDTINQYDGIKETVHKLIRSICPQFTWGLLDAGKKYFQRQERPEAWLSSRSIYGSSLLLLVCHVSGFYPKSIWVMWMRGEQEQLNTQQGDILPNADGTWYLHVTLDVEARDAVGLACWVRHSSLGGQDLILPWGGDNGSAWRIQHFHYEYKIISLPERYF